VIAVSVRVAFVSWSCPNPGIDMFPPGYHFKALRGPGADEYLLGSESVLVPEKGRRLDT